MEWQTILPEQRHAFDALVTHPLQSFSWGEFRKACGLTVVRRGLFDGEKLIAAFQLTIHPIPKTPYTIGYLPKGVQPDQALIEELQRIGQEHRCIFIQIEPNVIRNINGQKVGHRIWTMEQLRPAAHPLFTKYTFLLDLTKSEDELLAAMHAKARYNIKVAKKHNVIVKEDNSENAFARYWELTEETTRRQKFYAHTRNYHEIQWKTFAHSHTENQLTSHLFTASYDGKILTTLLFFVFKDTLYYPYGASSNEHRNVMHSQLAMWEGIRFGQKLGLKYFDMWGAMGPNPDQSDPWYGFHNFKQRFGPDHVEFIGSYDLVINPLLYQGYKVADKLRWALLKMR